MKKTTRMLLWVALLGLSAPAAAQELFKTPEEAASALVDAAKSGDAKAILTVLGPDGKAIVDSGDPVADSNTREKFIAAYARGIELIRTKPAEARPFLKGYTAIEGPMTEEVPLAAYTLHNEFTPSDVQYFQKFFDLFTDKGVFAQKVDVSTMLYKG